MRLFYFESPVSAGAGGVLHSLTCRSSRTDKHRSGRQWVESYETCLALKPPKTTTPMTPRCSCLWREMAGGVHTQVLPMSSVVPVDEE